ncbi:MAG: hypothetical protein HY966_07340 [Ignavibacteriales bacterium]|nr:hypothetical protein [Ignavibacteriales bacterium]
MTLTAGDVFLCVNPGLSGDDPHYHIVIHTTENRLVVVTYTTSQIEKVRRRCQRKEKIRFAHIEPETLVVVEPSDSPSFTKQCAIDCNNVQMLSEEYYVSSKSFQKVSSITNPNLIPRIKSAIAKSRIVEERIIRIVQSGSTSV